MSRSLILSSIVAGVMAAGAGASARADSAAEAQQKAMDEAMSQGDYRCPRGNMCKGKGACHGPGYSCAGNNKCLGKGFVMAKSKQDCDALRAKVQSATKAKARKKS